MAWVILLPVCLAAIIDLYVYQDISQDDHSICMLALVHVPCHNAYNLQQKCRMDFTKSQSDQTALHGSATCTRAVAELQDETYKESGLHKPPAAMIR